MNGTDLEYSHALHLLIYQSAIVSEKSLIFTFHHTKAYVTKFDLGF